MSNRGHWTGGIAENPATPPATLAKLAAASQDWIRRVTARNTAIPPAILAAIATDLVTDVHKAAAENFSETPAVLARLPADQEHLVRSAVADHRVTTPAILSVLAGDPDSSVRHGAARNAATPPAALVALVRDPDTSVRAALALPRGAASRALHACGRPGTMAASKCCLESRRATGHPRRIDGRSGQGGGGGGRPEPWNASGGPLAGLPCHPLRAAGCKTGDRSSENRFAGAPPAARNVLPKTAAVSLAVAHMAKGQL
jgi:hypothetical protein